MGDSLYPVPNTLTLLSFKAQQEGEIMQNYKKALLFIIFILMSATSMVYLMGWGAQMTVFHPSYYRVMIEEVNIVTDIHQSILSNMKDELPPDTAPEVFILLDTLGEVFHVEWVETQAMVAIDDALAFVKGEQQDLNTLIDLQERKHVLRIELMAALTAFAKGQPRLADVDEQTIESRVDEIIYELELPDDITFMAFLEGDDGTLSPEVARAIFWSKIFNRYFNFLPYVMLVAFLVAFCFLAGLYPGVQWFGVALVTASGMFLATLAVIRFRVLPNMIDVKSPFANTVTTIIQNTLSRFYLAPIMYIMVGMIMLIGGHLLHKSSSPKPPVNILSDATTN